MNKVGIRGLGLRNWWLVWGMGGGIYILPIVSRDITVTWKNTFVAFPKTELLL